MMHIVHSTSNYDFSSLTAGVVDIRNEPMIRISLVRLIDQEILRSPNS